MMPRRCRSARNRLQLHEPHHGRAPSHGLGRGRTPPPCADCRPHHHWHPLRPAAGSARRRHSEASGSQPRFPQQGDLARCHRLSLGPRGRGWLIGRQDWPRRARGEAFCASRLDASAHQATPRTDSGSARFKLSRRANRLHHCNWQAAERADANPTAVAAQSMDAGAL
jgi:hypothetical protein